MEKEFEKVRARGEVIERMANIETIMNAIISQKYLKQVTINFYLEVLYDENFSFALRRNIIEKITKSENNSKDIMQKLHKVNRIRNYMAHIDCTIYSLDELTKKFDDGITPDPRRLDDSLDFEQYYKEFIELSSEIEVFLKDIYEKLGGKLSDTKEGVAYASPQ